MAMDDSHMPHPIHFQELLDELDDLLVESELLLSRVEVLEEPPRSPTPNVAEKKELVRTADPPPIRKSKPYCGCGQYYSCTSSLYLHIRSKHGGNPPVGTIGGPKGIVKKPPVDPLDPKVKVEEAELKGNPYEPQKNVPKPVAPQPPAVVDRSRDEQSPKTCKICGKIYSCNSSLNLHLKRKHHIQKTPDGRVEYDSRLNQVEDRTPRSFQCTFCGLNYGSKSALGLHYNNKHNSKTTSEQGLPYDENRVQKCGCGLVYQSRSALNMHVKKKHDGVYPEGTSEKSIIRARIPPERPGEARETRAGTGDKLVIEEIVSEEGDKHSIYDSESDDRQRSSRSKQEQRQDEKVYKCGCGRVYTCSSSLNLHIKKNHQCVVPIGTIGGPKNIRLYQNQQPQPPQPVQPPAASPSIPPDAVCSGCSILVHSQPSFTCRSCSGHFLCSRCFWSSNHFSSEHEWAMGS